MKLTVCDSMCGSGKTSAAINFMNRHKDRRFIYITPFLSEVGRVVRACNMVRMEQVYVCEECYEAYDDKTGEFEIYYTGNNIYAEELRNGFYAPKEVEGKKANGFKELLKKNLNIATTHAMFDKFDLEIMDLIYAQNYTLILDEVVDVVRVYNELKEQCDKETLLKNYVDVDENGFLQWRKSEYGDYGLYSNIKNLCELNALSMYSTNNQKEILIWTLPVKAFTCFKSVMILTYMFDCQLQKYYFDMHGLEYKYCIATKNENGEYRFKKVDELPKLHLDSSLLDVYKGELNNIGNSDTALCSSWYGRAKKNDLLKKLKDNLHNYTQNMIGAKSKDIIWSCYKEYLPKLKGKGYTKGWLPMNVRARNDLRDRTTICYLVNIYYNPIIEKFFNTHGVKLDSDKYALSEMIQFLWRSCLRDGKPVNLYIPSKRMRNLLLNWLEDGSISTEDRDNESEDEIE